MVDLHYRDGERVVENWNDVFGALSAEPRRQLVVSLLDAAPDETVSLPDNAASQNVPTDSEALRRELYHNHLPRLAEKGFVEWETDPLVASRGPKFRQVAVVFEALHAQSVGLPDSLVDGCQRLEAERGTNGD